MTPLRAWLVIGAMLAALGLGALAYRVAYGNGYRAAEAKHVREIAEQRARIEDLNARITAKDGEIAQAKQEDRERVVTVYRTIREEAKVQHVEVPVYRECRVPADGMRRIAAAAAGELQADPAEPAGRAAGGAAGAR